MQQTTDIPQLVAGHRNDQQVGRKKVPNSSHHTAIPATTVSNKQACAQARCNQCASAHSHLVYHSGFVRRLWLLYLLSGLSLWLDQPYHLPRHDKSRHEQSLRIVIGSWSVFVVEGCPERLIWREQGYRNHDSLGSL